MNLQVTHVTQYTYSAPVWLDPHVIRLRPRTDGQQRLLAYELAVDPAPLSRTTVLDAEGNLAEHLYFQGHTDHLTLTSRFTVETSSPVPQPMAVPQLPVTLGPLAAQALLPWLVRRPPVQAVARLAAEVSHEAQGDALTFVELLAARIHQRVQPRLRETGDPRSPAETLRRGDGACRDLAVLWLAAARSQGLAARFVSGYHEGQDVRERHLHAWAEAYLPGLGWRGFDPTLGTAADERHVAVATGWHPRAAAPTEGTFRAGPVQSWMDVRIDVAHGQPGGAT